MAVIQIRKGRLVKNAVARHRQRARRESLARDGHCGPRVHCRSARHSDEDGEVAQPIRLLVVCDDPSCGGSEFVQALLRDGQDILPSATEDGRDDTQPGAQCNDGREPQVELPDYSDSESDTQPDAKLNVSIELAGGQPVDATTDGRKASDEQFSAGLDLLINQAANQAADSSGVEGENVDMTNEQFAAVMRRFEALNQQFFTLDDDFDADFSLQNWQAESQQLAEPFGAEGSEGACETTGQSVALYDQLDAMDEESDEQLQLLANAAASEGQLDNVMVSQADEHDFAMCEQPDSHPRLSVGQTFLHLPNVPMLMGIGEAKKDDDMMDAESCDADSGVCVGRSCREVIMMDDQVSDIDSGVCFDPDAMDESGDDFDPDAEMGEPQQAETKSAYPIEPWLESITMGMERLTIEPQVDDLVVSMRRLSIGVDDGSALAETMAQLRLTDAASG